MEDNLKKVGIIIIGNEILKGHVKDSNSGFLCKRFHAIGVKVCKIVTVADEKEEIAEEVARFSKKYDIVITTGGIGPTHDDITYEAIAWAFGVKVVLNSEMAEVIRSYFHGTRDLVDNPALKMALVPENSKLIYVLPKEEKDNWSKDVHNGLQDAERKQIAASKKPFPVVQVKNVYVLPGMMEWLEHAFDHLQTIFENSDTNIYTMILFLSWSEAKILNELNSAVAKFKDRVIFGSYPSQYSNNQFTTKIILESTSMDEVTSAHHYLKSSLPSDAINDELQRKDAELVYNLTHGNKSLSRVVKNSFKVIENAIKKYEPEEIYLSFNGGKDCTVLLHLVWAITVFLKMPRKLNCVYIKTDAVFPEVDDFVTRTAKRYDLNVEIVYGPIRAVLTELHHKNPTIKAIFMGTRRTDPHSANLLEFQVCDKDWPPLMRVNPILDWTYNDIWNFLRILDVPYCSLYDLGYTSIGNPKNTKPNSALKISGTKNKFLPAYQLKDESLERQGRQ